VRQFAAGRARLAAGDAEGAASTLARASRALTDVAAPYLGLLHYTRGRAALVAGKTDDANRFFEAALEAGYGKNRRQGVVGLEGIRRLVLQRSP
jgi:uncharacterized membrane-anchored protein